MLSTVLAQGIVPATKANKLSDLTGVFLNIISLLIPLGGIILFVMIVIGGFSLLTSGGVPQKVEVAKATITYAIIGIVLLACSYLIILLIARFTGVESILDFNLYSSQTP
jgi:hypothetical protein